MSASLLLAAPDSTTRMRQAADLVIDQTAADPAQQINALTQGRRCRVDWAAGTYQLRSPVLQRAGLEMGGEGSSTIVRTPAGFAGSAAFMTEPGARATLLEGFWLDLAGVAQGVSYQLGGPYTGHPATAPDSNHRIRHLHVYKPKGGIGLTSASGQLGLRGDSIVDVIVFGGAVQWGGSDAWLDDIVCRDSAVPLTIGGGSTRAGTLKAFYSQGVGISVASSRFDGALLHVQDCGADGISITGADCTVGMLTADSCGRLVPGDGVVLNAARARVTVRAIDRGQTVSSPMRNGVRIEAGAKGSIVDVATNGLAGQAVAGDQAPLAALRINGAWVKGAPPAEPVDLAPLTTRVATLEAGLAETASGAAYTIAQGMLLRDRVDQHASTLADHDAAIAEQRDGLAALTVLVAETAGRVDEHATRIVAATLRADELDARIAAVEQRIAATALAAAQLLPAADAAIATVNAKTAPNSLAAFRALRDVVARLAQ